MTSIEQLEKLTLALAKYGFHEGAKYFRKYTADEFGQHEADELVQALKEGLEC